MLEISCFLKLSRELPNIAWNDESPSVITDTTGRISPDLLSLAVKQGRQCQRREARKIFLRNPRIWLSISLLWLPCMFLFSLKFRWLQRLLLNETVDVSSWNVGHILKTAWKCSSWSLIWEQDGANVSFISHIHVRFLSSVISLIAVCRRCRRLCLQKPL